MKKIRSLIFVFALSIASFGAFPVEKADAASSGWSTQNGVTANVYTDRSGDYPTSDDWIGVTGQKTSAGGTVYYRMYVVKVQSDGTWVSASGPQSGYFASQSPRGTVRKMRIYNAKPISPTIPPVLTTLRKFQGS